VADAVAEASGQLSTGTDALAKALAAARRSLESVEKSPTVTAAAQLIRSVAEQTITTEQSRLLAMRQHLAAVQRLREALAVRDSITVCNVLFPAFGQIYTALAQAKQAEIGALFVELQKTGRHDCLPADLPPPVDVTDMWAKQRLGEYVAAEIRKNGDRAKSPELVGALGVLLFQDRRLFDDTQLALAREKHLYSIRLS